MPNVHYIPASLENITKVAEYALDDDNDTEIRRIVRRANEWCDGSRSLESLANRAVDALDEFRSALTGYYGGGGRRSWMEGLEAGSAIDHMDELVVCNV